MEVGDVAPSLPTRTGSPRHPCSSGCYSYPKSLAAADVATNTVAFSDFYIYFLFFLYFKPLEVTTARQCPKLNTHRTRFLPQFYPCIGLLHRRVEKP